MYCFWLSMCMILFVCKLSNLHIISRIDQDSLKDDACIL